MIATSLGFPGGKRLHTAADFSAVFANRRVLRGEHFDLHYLRVSSAMDAGAARLGLVVAKKFARSSVLRNLFKRIGREAFRHALPELPGCDLVLRLTKPAARVDRMARQAWRKEIDELLARLRIELSR